MIVVTVSQTEKGYLVSSEGHADPCYFRGEDQRHRICAAVSTLMVTLWLAACDVADHSGPSGGDVRLFVPKAHKRDLEFVLAGVYNLARSYPGSVKAVREDDDLVQKEELQWQRLQP